MIANTLDPDTRDFYTRREDLAFIVRFHWKSTTHLREAIRVLLAARIDDIRTSTAPAELPSSNVLEASEFQSIRRIIASNPNTPPAVLAYLAKHSEPDILERIAENPRTPLYALQLLAKCPKSSVRAAVAENVNVSADILTILIADPDDDVRYLLAESPHTPEELLIALTEDSNPYVSFRAEATLDKVQGGMVVTGNFLRLVREDRETSTL
jgi:hypothetical protein